MPLLKFPLPEPLPLPDLPRPLPPPLDRLPIPLPRPRPLPDLLPIPLPWFKECTPKILVVTDGLNFSEAGSFGLAYFVDTLRANLIHGMPPIVVTALFNPAPAAALAYDAARQHIDNFKFTDPTHGVRKSRYDIVFLLGINSSSPKLVDEAGALDAMTAFMQGGGGVFATGDHDELGAALCADLPRVRNMRNWRIGPPPRGVPSAGGVDRLTTNLPGADDVYAFADQSDAVPQRLYPNFRTTAGGVGFAHPLLQVPGSSRAIEVFPDHPHEGECFVPTDLATTLADGSPEWPAGAAGTRPAPEMVALTMSYGNAFPGKAAVTPRSFVAVCAYDGQAANVGRVVTDATWHHFVNINIRPGNAALSGRNLDDIRQYYKNLATWLMPKNVRYCRRYPWLITELMRYPLFEELSPLQRDQRDAQALRQVGATVVAALAARHTRAEVQALIDDALEEGLGVDARIRLQMQEREGGGIKADDVGLAALGAVTLAVADAANEVGPKTELDGEKLFGPVGREASAQGAKAFITSARQNVKKLAALMDAIAS